MNSIMYVSNLYNGVPKSLENSEAGPVTPELAEKFFTVIGKAYERTRPEALTPLSQLPGGYWYEPRYHDDSGDMNATLIKPPDEGVQLGRFMARSTTLRLITVEGVVIKKAEKVVATGRIHSHWREWRLPLTDLALDLAIGFIQEKADVSGFVVGTRRPLEKSCRDEYRDMSADVV